MKGGLAVRRLGGWAVSVAAVLPAAYPPSRLAAQDPWPILDHASVAYQAVRTLSADFVQIVVNPLLGTPDTTRGRLYQQRPNRFAMRFARPRGDRLVADGRWLWLYTPSTTPGQVIRAAIPAAGPTGPNLIGQFVERPRERYQARYLRADSLDSSVVDGVALVPNDPDAPYGEAVIWVHRGDGLLRRIEITDRSGQRRVVILRSVVANATVPRGEFTFSPPAGVRVVDQ